VSACPCRKGILPTSDPAPPEAEAAEGPPRAPSPTSPTGGAEGPLVWEAPSQQPLLRHSWAAGAGGGAGGGAGPPASPKAGNTHAAMRLNPGARLEQAMA
jgi:hypothetical protein